MERCRAAEPAAGTPLARGWAAGRQCAGALRVRTALWFIQFADLAAVTGVTVVGRGVGTAAQLPARHLHTTYHLAAGRQCAGAACVLRTMLLCP